MRASGSRQRRLVELMGQLSTEALVDWPVRLVRLDSDGLPEAVLFCDPVTGQREVARLRGAAIGATLAHPAAAEEVR